MLDARGAVSATERARRSAGCGRWPGTSPASGPTAAPSSGIRWGSRRRPPRPPRTVFAEVGDGADGAAGDRHRGTPRRRGHPGGGIVARRAGRPARRTRLARGRIRTFATPRRIVALVDDGGAARARGASAPSAGRGSARRSTPTASRPRRRWASPALRAPRWPGCAGSARTASTTSPPWPRPIPGAARSRSSAAVFARAVAELRADVNMRWSDPNLSYVRPIRWLLALLGDAAVPVAVSSLASAAHHPGAPHRRRPGHRGRPGRRVRRAAGRARRDHRPAAPPGADHRRGPGARRQRRRHHRRRWRGRPDRRGDQPGRAAGAGPRRLRRAISQPARRDPHHRDAQAPALPPGAGRRGGADGVFRGGGERACDHESVRAGNEAVLRARYEDASFFWRADLRTPRTGCGSG